MELKHNEKAHQFEATEAGQTAVVEYKLYEGGINILHTYAPKPLQNRGITSALVKRALDYAREKHFKVILSCPFARVYVARHKEYEDLLQTS